MKSLPFLKRWHFFLAIAVIVAVSVIAWFLWEHDAEPVASTAEPPRPALTVELIKPQPAQWPITLTANGNVQAWQEAVIGAEIANYRLTAVLVNVGDHVAKDQVLARIADENIAADVAQSAAVVAEAAAGAEEAKFNADRARKLREAGFYSPQQAQQSITQEQTAQARLEAARARHRADQLRLAQTVVRAPDDGVISARTATVGSLSQPGQELFRLIRGGRLEWRAELTGDELSRLKPGFAATVSSANGTPVTGKLRALSPTLDPSSRNAIAYVDLPASAFAAGLRAGTYARGSFTLGNTPALTIPQAALVMRDGFAYVFTLGPDTRVVQTKVGVGRRNGERVEIVQGLAADASIVAGGAGFLGDGDPVRVVTPAVSR